MQDELRITGAVGGGVVSVRHGSGWRHAGVTPVDAKLAVPIGMRIQKRVLASGTVQWSGYWRPSGSSPWRSSSFSGDGSRQKCIRFLQGAVWRKKAHGMFMEVSASGDTYVSPMVCSPILETSAEQNLFVAEVHRFSPADSHVYLFWACRFRVLRRRLVVHAII